MDLCIDSTFKKFAPLYILQILEKHSDNEHPIKHEKIVELLDSEYGLIIERKAIGRNISLLNEAGYEFEDVIKTTCFLENMEDFAKFNEIYTQYFTSKPARSCVQAKLPKGAKVEVEIIAKKVNH